MVVDYIKKAVPSEIVEGDIASVQIVNKHTVPLETSVQEALDGNYVIGRAGLVQDVFRGLFKSAILGMQRDGKARKIGNLLTIYPSVRGTFDLDAGWNPLVNSVNVNARLLKNYQLDTSNWTFRDVTPGKVSFSLKTVTTGDVSGVVGNGKSVEFNGDFTGLTASDVTIEWSCNGKSGTYAGSTAGTSLNVSRLTTANTILDSLTLNDDGKEITFVMKACFTKKEIKAKFSFVRGIVWDVKFAGASAEVHNTIQKGDPFIAYCTKDWASGDSCIIKWLDAQGVIQTSNAGQPTEHSATQMTFAWPSGFSAIPDNANATFEFVMGGVTKEVSVTVWPAI